MKNRKIKTGGAGFLALVLLLAGLKLPRAYAALPIDLTKKGTIEFQLAQNVYQNQDPSGTGQAGQPVEFNDELKELPLHISLYQVATVEENGAYTAVGGYETLPLDKADSDTKAEEWLDMAQQAAALVDEKGMAVRYEKDNAAGEDAVKFENIELGLYLVMVDAVKSPYYFYSFSPYLVAVPGNDYYNSSDDSWIYELTEKQAVGLKPAREPRFGDLVIRKNLTSYNASVGGAYFVYEVSVLPLGAAKPETNVYRISFNRAGKDALTITGLPAGAAVTVKEVYTGASYTLSSAAEQTAQIVAMPTDDEQAGDYPAEVEFSNKYDGRHNGGSGVVNTFYKDSNTIGCENDGDGGVKADEKME